MQFCERVHDSIYHVHVFYKRTSQLHSRNPNPDSSNRMSRNVPASRHSKHRHKNTAPKRPHVTSFRRQTQTGSRPAATGYDVIIRRRVASSGSHRIRHVDQSTNRLDCCLSRRQEIAWITLAGNSVSEVTYFRSGVVR